MEQVWWPAGGSSWGIVTVVHVASRRRDCLSTYSPFSTSQFPLYCPFVLQRDSLVVLMNGSGRVGE